MRRHPELSLRAPEPTTIARACGFNKPQIQKSIECYVEHHTPPTSPIPSCFISPTQKTTHYVDRSRSISPIPTCSYHINDENVDTANKDIAKCYTNLCNKTFTKSSTAVKEALRNQKAKPNQKVRKTKLPDKMTNSKTIKNQI
jgi:hypothetical protein